MNVQFMYIFYLIYKVNNCNIMYYYIFHERTVPTTDQKWLSSAYALPHFVQCYMHRAFDTNHQDTSTFMWEDLTVGWTFIVHLTCVKRYFSLVDTSIDWFLQMCSVLSVYVTDICLIISTKCSYCFVEW